MGAHLHNDNFPAGSSAVCQCHSAMNAGLSLLGPSINDSNQAVYLRKFLLKNFRNGNAPKRNLFMFLGLLLSLHFFLECKFLESKFLEVVVVG